MAPIPRIKSYAGPSLFSYGFRPFFLGASLFAGLAVPVWLAAYFGAIEVPTAFSPRDWHVHEMIYGFLPAVLAGYLLTSTPNWTGRLPLQGGPLVALFSLWIAGRSAVATSGRLPWALVAALDLSFLTAVLLAVTREVVAGRNGRNLWAVGLVGLLWLGDLAFHFEAHALGGSDYGARAGFSALTLLVVTVGGRLIPSFTRNWLSRAQAGRLPASFGSIDIAAIASTALALAVWTLSPDSEAAAALLLFAALLQAIRLARWAGERTLGNRLVLVLHVAYAFLPAGFTLLAWAALGRVSRSAGVHAITIGCLSLMTMAVMSRSSLSHTGRRAVASLATQSAYAMLALAALSRVAAAIWTDATVDLLWASGLSWAFAFAVFLAAYWRVFTQPSLTAR